MPRTLSNAFRAAINAQESREVLLPLVTIDHESLATPLRFVHNLVDVNSRGNTYIRSAFQITLPGERDDELPVVTLTIDNVDQAITVAIRSLDTAPVITLECIVASAPDVVEVGPFPFTLKNVSYDAFTITGRLAFEDVLNEAAPAHSFNPNEFPGLFA